MSALRQLRKKYGDNDPRVKRWEAEFTPPEFDASLRYLWDFFCALNSQRSYGAMAPNPIQFSCMHAYSQMRGIYLDGWEIDAVCQIDQVFLMEWSKKKKQDGGRHSEPRNHGRHF